MNGVNKRWADEVINELQIRNPGLRGSLARRGGSQCVFLFRRKPGYGHRYTYERYSATVPNNLLINWHAEDPPEAWWGIVAWWALGEGEQP